MAVGESSGPGPPPEGQKVWQTVLESTTRISRGKTILLMDWLIILATLEGHRRLNASDIYYLRYFMKYN